ncbi:MAG: type I methionyl aminopeptidase [Candidatus Omnitrophica bacterium]|nr:type I methionyl aminopeptidase [Candidatus Omnitrophota bacterium]
MIELKTAQELVHMRQAGAVVAKMLQAAAQAVAPGVKTKTLDDVAARVIEQAGAQPAFKGYRGYPATICVSINDEVVHGIPGHRAIREGDVVSIDAGAKVAGYYADAAITVAVGAVPQASQRLINVTKDALAKGIAQALPANRLGDISHIVQGVVEGAGLSIVRDFVGHGIGRALHEDPPIPNFGLPNQGPRLKPGMVLAIEPMVTIGGWEVEVLADGWTAVTKDHSLAAHFEHTVAITEHGPEILTQLESWN